VTVVTYLASAAFVGRIRHDETLPDRADRRPLRTEIAEGLRFVVHQPLLRRIVATTSISNFFSGVEGALMVIYSLRILGIDEAGLGLVFSTSAIGGLLGALTADRWSRWVGEGRIVPVSALAMGPAF